MASDTGALDTHFPTNLGTGYSNSRYLVSTWRPDRKYILLVEILVRIDTFEEDHRRLGDSAGVKVQ